MAMTKITNRVFMWLRRADALAGPNSIKTAGSWQEREHPAIASRGITFSDSKVWPADNNAADVYELSVRSFYHGGSLG